MKWCKRDPLISECAHFGRAGRQLLLQFVGFFGILQVCRGWTLQRRRGARILSGWRAERIHKTTVQGRWLRDEGWLFPLRLQSMNLRMWMNVGRVAFEVCGRRELPRRYLARAINHAEYTHAKEFCRHQSVWRRDESGCHVIKHALWWTVSFPPATQVAQVNSLVL